MGTMNIDEFQMAADEGFQTADSELWKRMLVAIKSDAIPDNPEENEDLCNQYRTGAHFAYCYYCPKKDDTEYGPMAWAARIAVNKGRSTRTIYRGTLYQCALAVDCYNLAREPFAWKPYDRHPAGRQAAFKFDEENVVKPALANPVLGGYMEFVIQRLQEQGLLRSKTSKERSKQYALKTLPAPTWERWEKVFSQLEDQAAQLGRTALDVVEVRQHLDTIANQRLEGIEQLLSEIRDRLERAERYADVIQRGGGPTGEPAKLTPEQIKRAVGPIVFELPCIPEEELNKPDPDPTNEAGMAAALSDGITPAPENTKERSSDNLGEGVL